MADRPSASISIVSGYSPPCSMVSKRRPAPVHVWVLRAFVRRHLRKSTGELHQKVLAGARRGPWGSSTVWVGSSLTTESRYPVKLLQYNVAGFERRFAGLMAFFRSFFLADRKSTRL